MYNDGSPQVMKVFYNSCIIVKKKLFQSCIFKQTNQLKLTPS